MTYSVRYSSGTTPPSWRLHVVAVEPGGEPLLLGRLRQQVAGELPGDEAIERQVPVERRNHPVAPRPHLAHAIVLIAVRVGVARDVEPFGGHLLAVGGGGEQAIDDFLVRVRGAIGDEGVDLVRASAAARSGRASRGAATSRATLPATA